MAGSERALPADSPDTPISMQRQRIVLGQANAGIVPAREYYCGCLPPRFRHLQWLCGFTTTYLPGFSHYWCCLYGCDKPDWDQVCLAGLLTTATSPCLYGWATACITGYRMMGCRCGLQPDQVVRVQPDYITKSEESKRLHAQGGGLRAA